MKVIYVPVYKAAVSYAVSLGRRWSLLEHMLLIELADNRRSVAELSALSGLQDRIIVEALINLLRARWIEVRSTHTLTTFAATALGQRRAAEEELKPELRREIKWVSLCMERLTGSWARSGDLDLVYQDDLPEDAYVVDPILGTLTYEDPGVRDLVYLNSNEGFEGFEPARGASRPYARVVVEFGEVQKGLPSYSTLAFRTAALRHAEVAPDLGSKQFPTAASPEITLESPRDNFSPDDLVVGGPAHFECLVGALRQAKSHFILHSCFLHPNTIRQLLTELESAARRKVRIDLLWGLRSDPEAAERPPPISECERILGGLDPAVRERVHLSEVSSGSHCKVIAYDAVENGEWEAVVGSCNFLSTQFDALDVSVRTRSQRLIAQTLGYLIAAQVPPSGSWSQLVRRLNRSWDSVRRNTQLAAEVGEFRLTLLADADHYACVTKARDEATNEIVVACDLFGLSAETSVLVPLERAGELGKTPRLFYSRPSRFLSERGGPPDADAIRKRGMDVVQVEELHGKFLMWDSDALAISSFNWLASSVTGSRSRGAELGVLIQGPGIAALLREKLRETPLGR